MTRITALLGTLFYLVWGALHIQAGIAVARLGTGIHHSTAIQGRIYQDSWTLFFAAGIVILVALISNWNGWTTSYWINLGVAGITDIGFIIFIIVPGYAPLWPGLQGPVAWSIATLFWTWSYILRKHDTGPSEISLPAGSSSQLGQDAGGIPLNTRCLRPRGRARYSVTAEKFFLSRAKTRS